MLFEVTICVALENEQFVERVLEQIQIVSNRILQFGRLHNCLKIISVLLCDWQKLTFPVQNIPASQLFLWQMAPFLGTALQFLAHIHPSLL